MLLQAIGLRKTYGGVPVLADLEFALAVGEIRALVGENGAGKSTLIKILSGAVVPDRGAARIHESPIPFGDPLAVRRLGVSIVYQEFTLVADMTVGENIFLGREEGRPLLNRDEMTRTARRYLEMLGLALDPRVTVRGLSVAHQQLVEIARALVADARVLILDEPTATLSPPEVDRLLSVLKQLRARGLGIVYVSHRLEEIFAVADTVTILRDGRHIETAPVGALTRDRLIQQMVGRAMSEEFPARQPTPGPVVLDVRHLSGRPRFTDVSLTVREGEIVGLAGLVGAGRTSTALAMAGMVGARGDVWLGGRPVRFRSPAAAVAGGLAYITEDRKAWGIFPWMGVGDNITITHLDRFTTAGWLVRSRARDGAAAAVREFDVRTSGLGQRAGTLSGGNQQKALLARYLIRPPRVLILDEPTRGVDVGARAEIYRVMNRLTSQGLGILMISSDLPELLGMSDRIVVMREGRTTGELLRAEATAERVMALATAAA